MIGRPARIYPPATRLDLTEHQHGLRIEDPYRWLEDPGSDETAAWTVAQERLFDAERAGWAGRELWKADLTAASAASRTSPPLVRGTRMFYTFLAAGANHPVLMVAENGVERVLLDPLALDPSGETVLDSWRPSPDGSLLACQISSGGTEDSQLRVLDVTSGQVTDGPIGRLRSSPVAWLPGGKLFFYVRRLPPELVPGEERYHRRVYLHQVGADPEQDSLVFGDGQRGESTDKTRFYSVTVTQDGRWLTITATTGADPATELWIADLSSGQPQHPELRQVSQNGRGRSKVHIGGGTKPGDPIWLSTDRDAPRGRIVAATPARPGEEHWQELISQRPGAVLTDFALLGGPELDRPVALVTWTRRAVSEITVHDLADGRQLGALALPGVGTVSHVFVQPEGGHEAWFWYTDHATALVVLRYDARSGEISPWPGDAGSGAAPDVVTRQVTFTSADGTQVPMFVIAPALAAAAEQPDRARPAILTGYGGFGVSMKPGYQPEALAWVRAGGVFAVACLRGGGEEGRDWHLAGRGQLKQNVFDDFEAAGDYLVSAGWTSRAQLTIMGNSNGGLLVGAALTQHPEKYSAVVCMSPLLDMARYELSGLGPSWRPEYGSADDPGQLKTLLAYSPYHNVRPGVAYPPVLFAVAEGDTRVDPLHARKMCAAVQYSTSGPGPVLLRLERGVGHGARAASREIDLQADCLAFLAMQTGLMPPDPQ